MIRLYNVLREFLYLSNPEEPKLVTPESETLETEADPNLGLNKALDTYRKLIEKNTSNPTEPLTDKEQEKLENRIKEIEVCSAALLKAEPKVDEGRLDFLLSSEKTDALTYIEVKSVTLLGHSEAAIKEDNIGYFPDAVTSRGLKHLEVLMRLKEEGQRSILFFCVPHEGIKRVKVAEHVDPAYAKKLRQVMAAGVEVLAYQVEFHTQGMVLKTALEVSI